MRKYVRTDTRKVYEDEVKIIDDIIAEHKLPPKQGKSAAYGIGLQTWKDLRQIPNSVQDLKEENKRILEALEQNYFVIQALVAQIAELREEIKRTTRETTL